MATYKFRVVEDSRGQCYAEKRIWWWPFFSSCFTYLDGYGEASIFLPISYDSVAEAESAIDRWVKLRRKDIIHSETTREVP